MIRYTTKKRPEACQTANIGCPPSAKLQATHFCSEEYWTMKTSPDDRRQNQEAGQNECDTSGVWRPAGLCE